MPIDEKLLAEVMKNYHLPTKTEAVDFALKELVRLDRLRALAGLTIKGPDLIIATCALQSGAAVTTLDSDFDHVPGLVVLRPELLQ